MERCLSLNTLKRKNPRAIAKEEEGIKNKLQCRKLENWGQQSVRKTMILTDLLSLLHHYGMHFRIFM